MREPGVTSSSIPSVHGAALAARLFRRVLVLLLCACSMPVMAQYEVAVRALEAGDYAAAWMMLAPLARAGDPRAQHDVGVMFALGLGMEPSMEQASNWLLKAAEQGNTRSQARLGWMYFHGAGVPRDAVLAARWSRAAAEAGDAWAQSNYGFSLDQGEGVVRDRVAAARWYRRSAEQGFPEGQRNLGALFESGQGVPRDPVRAYAWYGVAAVGGDGRAIALRERLETRLDAAQLDRARALARELLDTHGSHPELGG